MDFLRRGILKSHSYSLRAFFLSNIIYIYRWSLSRSHGEALYTIQRIYFVLAASMSRYCRFIVVRVLATRASCHETENDSFIFFHIIRNCFRSNFLVFMFCYRNIIVLSFNSYVDFFFLFACFIAEILCLSFCCRTFSQDKYQVTGENG